MEKDLKKEPSESEKEEVKLQIRNAVIMNDIFSRAVFKNPKCTEILVNTILENPVKVIESITQYNMENAIGRAAIVDVLAKTKDGKRIVIEIQKITEEGLPLRARHICSVSDANLIGRGARFRDIHEFFVIFIMEKDPFGRGQSIYKVYRIFDDTHELFPDKQTIIFVNGATKEEGELRELLDDFSTRDYWKMKNRVFREEVRHIKSSTEKEDIEMIKFFTEEMRKEAKLREAKSREEGLVEGIEIGREEGRAEGREQGIQQGIEKGREEGREEGFFQSAINLLKLGFSVEDAQRVTGLSIEKINELKAAF